MVDEPRELVKEKECLFCWDALWYLVFCGFAVFYIVKLNLSLTIIAMVVAPRLKASTPAQYFATISSTGFMEWRNYKTDWTKIGSSSKLHGVEIHPSGKIDKNRTVISLVIFVVTELIFGLTIFIPAALDFLAPVLVHHHFYAFVILRALQGAASGGYYSAMHSMTAKWIPVSERSKFISTYNGGSVGAAITYPMCAMLINWFGWNSVFYVTSTFGIIWCVTWYCLAFDTPQEHPRISLGEKTYILDRLGNSVNIEAPRKIPWKATLTSFPV